MIGIYRRAAGRPASHGSRWRLFLSGMVVAGCALGGSAGGQTPPSKTPAPSRAAAAKAPSAAQTPSSGFQVGAPAPWVRPMVPDRQLAQALPPSPVHVLMSDRQTLVEQARATHYVHAVRLIRESAGLETGAQIQIDFDPTYEKLTLHHVRVRRNGAELDRLDVRKVQLLQRETGLERQIYDGRLTATLAVADVRLGDEIDFAYTLSGSNPVFGGKFVDTEWTVGSVGPMALMRLRLLSPPEREIRHSTGSPQVEVETRLDGPLRETVFRRKAAPQFRYDPSAPERELLKDQIHLSEFRDWQQVAGWAEGLFTSAAAGDSPEVDAQAAAIRAAAATPEQRVVLALDFVQKQVRYLGTEIGANSHLPARPEQVMKQRFGDCKDKVSLLAALLRRLEIDATPVLVSTPYRQAVAGMLPSPLAFNHAIAMVQVGGQKWLLDGTRGQQTGPLEERTSVGLGVGLLARAASTTPEALPGFEKELRMSAVEVLRFQKMAEAPTLESTVSFHGELAEGLRGALGNPSSRADTEKQFLADFARAYPTLQSQTPMQVEEVPGHNAVQLRFSFVVPGYLRFVEQKYLSGDYALLGLMQALRLSDQGRRETPYRLGYPGVYRHKLSLSFPEAVFSKPGNSRFDESNRHFELRTTSETLTDSASMQGELKVLQESVEATDWSAYRDSVTKASPRLAGTVTLPTVSAAGLEELTQRWKKTTEDLRSGKVRAATRVQVEAMSQLMLIEAQFAARRLSPAMQSQLFVSKGVNLDHLNRLDEAQAAFQQALQLDPSNAEAHAGLAVNALMRQQGAAALDHATQALVLVPGDNGSRYVRAYAHYFTGAPAQARDELTELMQDSRERDRGYASIWMYLSQRRLGLSQADAVAAAQPLPAAPRTPGSAAAWPLPVWDLLRGTATRDQVLAAARADAAEAEGRLCELYFYLAEMQALNGQYALARENYQKAIDTRVMEFNEYGFARWALSRLPS